MPDFDDETLADLDDSSLLDAHLSGDARAFPVLVGRYRRLCSFIAFNIVRDRDLADDVVQSAMLAVFRTAPQFDRRASVKTWIGRITRNAALDVLRRQAARPTVPMGEWQEERAIDPADVAAIAGDRTVVDELLVELPETSRQIVVMIDLLDQSFDTVATILEIPVGTVKSRRWRALRLLAERFER